MPGSTLRAILLMVGVVLATSAHVGTSNAYFEGMAGPYGIRVIARTPGVIPGLTQISVRVTSGEGVERVTVRPLRWDAGLEGAPPADQARPVAGDPQLYAAELWLMTAGSYSVHVNVEGSAGGGTAFVPVVAVAERRLEMGRTMGLGLLAAAVFLFVGAITVFGAAIRESVLLPGLAPDRSRRRQARVAMTVSTVMLSVLLWGGWTWWDVVDAAYRDRMYRPASTVASVTGTGQGRVLALKIDDEGWGGRDWTPLMPDHGKLMHMFLVKEGDLSVFAHLHPAATGSDSFAVSVRDVPPGGYRIYADIVHESGFAQTLTNTVHVPFASAPAEPDATPLPTDPDDSWAEVAPLGASRSARYLLPSGRALQWERDASGLLVDQDTTLRFSLTEPDGTPSRLEPYMGMLSHAAVTRDDGTVFVHLHPSGSINLAAQRRFEREEGGPVASSSSAHHAETNGAAGSTSVVSFPFVFPAAGPYRIFIQIKVAGEVETAVFDVDVADA